MSKTSLVKLIQPNSHLVCLKRPKSIHTMFHDVHADMQNVKIFTQAVSFNQEK